MFKGNSNLGHGAILLLAIALFYGFSTIQHSSRLRTKMEHAIRTTYEVDTFRLETLRVPETVDAVTQIAFNGSRLFGIRKQKTIIGYAYLGEAKSMKKVFDYVVLFHPDLSIKKSKVLIYREDYGQQIGSQRWLKQFIGLAPGENAVYGDNIDAIAGATISASSMTRAVDALLQGVNVLKQKEIIN
ncbi:FMN-binding protein [Flavobacteriaceae bacterium 3-367]